MYPYLLTSSETITLKVTNKAGEQTIQSVVIETVEPNQSASSLSNSSRDVPSSNQFLSVKSSSDNLPDKQAPIEFPPWVKRSLF